jgi:hypothetical protein
LWCTINNHWENWLDLLTMVYTLSLIFMMWTISWILQLKIRPCGWWTSRHNLCFILKIHKNNTNKMIMNIIKNNYALKLETKFGSIDNISKQHDLLKIWTTKDLVHSSSAKKINIVAFLFKFINSMKIHGLCFMFPCWNHTIIHNLSKSFLTTSTNWDQRWTKIWSERNYQL